MGMFVVKGIHTTSNTHYIMLAGYSVIADSVLQLTFADTTSNFWLFSALKSTHN